MNPLFYFLAGLTLIGAIAAMSLRNPVHCALCLVVTFVGLAGVYLELGAQFLGLAQVVVYVGAVAILLVFVLLLTRSGGSGSGSDGDAERRNAGGWGWLGGVLLGGGVAGILVAAVLATPGLPRRETPPPLPSVEELGQALMTEFVLPLQVVGVLLTGAMIGAAIIALQERNPSVKGLQRPPAP